MLLVVVVELSAVSVSVVPPVATVVVPSSVVSPSVVEVLDVLFVVVVALSVLFVVVLSSLLSCTVTRTEALIKSLVIEASNKPV